MMEPQMKEDVFMFFHLLSVISNLQIHGNINFHEFFILLC